MSKTKFFEELKQKKVFEIRVKVNSSKNEMTSNGNYTLSVKAGPENNKANTEIIKFLEKNTGMKARILKGKTSKNKTIMLS